MNWEAIGALGEIIGALAVLLTLFYLALQIRQNTHQIQEAAIQDTIHLWNSVSQTILSNPEIAELIEKGNNELSELSPTEKQRYLQYCMMVLRAAWAQDRNVMAQNMQFEDRTVIGWLGDWMEESEGIREMWNELRHYYPHDFQNRIEQELKNRISESET